MAHHCRNNVWQRRYLLLVQLYTPSAYRRCRISRSQHHAIDDTGRPRHGLRKPREGYQAVSLRDWLLHSLRDVQHCFFFLFSFGHHTLYSWCCLCAFAPCLYSPYQVHNSFLSYVTHKEENYWEQPVYKWHSI